MKSTPVTKPSKPASPYKNRPWHVSQCRADALVRLALDFRGRCHAPCRDSRLRLSRAAKRAAPLNKKPRKSSGAFFFQQSFFRTLCHGRLHILLRLRLKFLPAILRAEKIFPARKLRMKSGFFLVHFHSTNRVSSHDSSVLKWISPTSLQKSCRSFQVFRITDPADFFAL